MNLLQELDRVQDEKTFMIFVEALRCDFELASEDWENHTIDSFLAAAQAWAQHPQIGIKQSFVIDSPWKRFAFFLYCGKVYE